MSATGIPSAWSKLTRLTPSPIELARIELVRTCPLERLRNPKLLESLLLDLGLNDEGLDEFPADLHRYCGQGLRIWQYPRQFSRYLVALSRLGVTSYLELGVRHGGTFVATVEYLQRFTPLDHAVGVDIIPCAALDSYRQQYRPNADFACLDTQKPAFTELLQRHGRFDLVLIDSLHEAEHCRNEVRALQPYANMLAFHDIASDSYPEVATVWRQVQAHGDYECYEFIDQYDSVQGRFMGIGLAIRNDRLAVAS